MLLQSVPVQATRCQLPQFTDTLFVRVSHLT